MPSTNCIGGLPFFDIEKNGYNDRSELAHALVAVIGNTKTENFNRVIALATRNSHATDSLMAAYSRASLLASNYDNVFAAGKRCACPDLDRDVLAALCIEGLAPASIPGLKAVTHPAVRCLALLKGGGVARRSRTKKDLSHLFVGCDGPDARFAEDIHYVMYETFFAALAVGLSGGKAQEWSKIPTGAQASWLSQAVRALERLAGYIAERWRISRLWPTLQDIYNTFDMHPPTPESYEERCQFIAIRLALRDIAIDLCTIAIGRDANAYFDAGDIESASMSPFWLDELWLDAFSERRLPLHTPEAAQIFVNRVASYLDTNITVFNERATAAVKLAQFASDHGLLPLAQKELRRAIECLLGYGWHKDMFAFEVLESLDLLAKNGDEDARKTLLDLAGEFEAITIYTDGDHTRHTRADYYEAIAFHFPKLVPVCYAHLIRNEEWYYAEGLATAIVATDRVEPRTGQALLESYIAPGEAFALENSNSASRPYIGAALTVVRRKTGRSIGRTLDHEASRDTGHLDSQENDSSTEKAATSVPDPCVFPPGHLPEYLNEVRNMQSFGAQRKLVTEWLRYWEISGYANEALTDLEAAISETTSYNDLEDVLDVAFEIALKAQGRSKAFSWLSRAHISSFGWYRRMSSNEEAQARMRAVAQHYRGQWREFIEKTATPRYAVGAASNGIHIGLSRLVYFLTEVGELDLARDYALEIARIFKAELNEQPIETPEWSK